jgi:mono/diheme cytochrome c family protein
MLRLGALAAIAALSIATPVSAQEGDVAHGRDLARQHCARCHVIKNYNPYGGAGNSPTFDRLVTWDDGIARMASFFQRPPHPVFVRMEGVAPNKNVPPTAATFELTLEDIEDLVAFAKKLRQKQGTAD